MADEVTARGRPPTGIILLCLVFGLYALLWMLTWLLAGAVGNDAIALLSLLVATGVLLLAFFLYRGSPAAWWIAVAFVGGSTLWRLSLVAGGEPDNLLNAAVGVLLLLYLLSRHGFYQSVGS